MNTEIVAEPNDGGPTDSGGVGGLGGAGRVERERALEGIGGDGRLEGWF